MFKKMKEQGHPFGTARPEDSNLINLLETNGIEYQVQIQNLLCKPAILT